MEILTAATDSILSGAIEVGVGIVGFTGVIATLATRRRQDFWIIGFQTLLFTAIATIMFSFLPFLVLQFGFDQHFLWMIFSGTYLLYFPIILLIRARQISKFSGEALAESGLARRVFGGFGVGMLAIAVLQILNLFVFQTYWPYLTLVIFYVFFSLSTFAVITLMLWNVNEDT
jgi:hypothetical protein